MATENSIGLDEALLTQLCEAICDRNPYRNNMQLSANWRDEIEQDYYQAGYWKFKDRSLRVAKAIRIPYTYLDKDGNKVREYLLIEYEGSGGE